MSGGPGGSCGFGGPGAVCGAGGGASLPLGPGVVQVDGAGGSSALTGTAGQIPFFESGGNGQLKIDGNFIVTTTGDGNYKFMSPTTLTLFRGTPPSVGIGGGATSPSEMLYAKGATANAANMTFKDAVLGELTVSSLGGGIGARYARVVVTDTDMTGQLRADFTNGYQVSVVSSNVLQFRPGGGGTNQGYYDGVGPPSNFISSGPGGLATTATTGFTFGPSCAGTPTGVPTAITNMVPMVYDRTANKVWFYNGAWRGIVVV